jgi:hypothetical protein
MWKVIGALVAMLGAGAAAQAGVHSVQRAQFLAPPGGQMPDGFPALAVAIDGDSLITILDREGARQALLYRRGRDGQWSYSRTLLQSTAPASQLRASVAMKNWLAAIDIDGTTTIWERTGNDWVRATVDDQGLTLMGGHAISGRRVLVGSTGCDLDGVVYQKASDGVWRFTLLPESREFCRAVQRDVDLNYDHAVINNNPLGTVHVYRPDPTRPDAVWTAAGTIELRGESINRGGALAVQNGIAVAPGSTYYRRAGNSWNFAGNVRPVDFAMGSGDAEQVVFRDRVLVTVETNDLQQISTPYAYVLDASGRFRHVARFPPYDPVHDIDISQGTVVIATTRDNGYSTVQVFNLPEPLVPPANIANDFNANDVSGFEATRGSGFVLGGNQYNRLYRQSNSSGEAHVALSDSDWTGYQSVRLKLRVNSIEVADGWGGVAVRYVDANNFYQLAVRNGVVQLNRRVNGVTTTLAQYLPPGSLGEWLNITLTADGSYVSAAVNEDDALQVYDTSFTHGRVALMTQRARADFDDLRARATPEATAFFRGYTGSPDYGRPWTEYGGQWIEPPAGDTAHYFKQIDTRGLAMAIIGTPIDDQVISAGIRVDSFAGSQPTPWAGLVARYVDARNYYYLSIRGSNQVQIRKVVNGVSTVLSARSLAVPIGQVQGFRFEVVGNELHATVNGELVATAIDSDLKQGRYGIATYHAAASFMGIRVVH